MGHMQRDIQRDYWFEVSYDGGSTHWIPSDALAPSEVARFKRGMRANDIREMLEQYVPGTIDDAGAVKLIVGYGARMSAPGYLDCTEWCVFSSRTAALAYLVETYGSLKEMEGEES